MLFALLGASLILAADSDAALQPSSPADIASAVGDCWNAVSARGIDKAELGKDGWTLFPGTDNLAVTPLQVWTKPGANHRILLTGDPRASDYCTVITRLSSKGEAEPALKAKLAALKSRDDKVTPERTASGVAFVSLPRFAQVDPTDAAGATEDQPSLRIMVGYQTPEKK